MPSLHPAPGLFINANSSATLSKQQFAVKTFFFFYHHKENYELVTKLPAHYSVLFPGHS